MRRFQFYVIFFRREISMSVLRATCVMKVKIVRGLDCYLHICGAPAVEVAHTYTHKKATKTQNPPKNHRFSHSQRRAASLENTLKWVVCNLAWPININLGIPSLFWTFIYLWYILSLDIFSISTEKRIFLLSTYAGLSDNRYFYSNSYHNNSYFSNRSRVHGNLCETVNIKSYYVAFSQRLTLHLTKEWLRNTYP